MSHDQRTTQTAQTTQTTQATQRTEPDPRDTVARLRAAADGIVDAVALAGQSLERAATAADGAAAMVARIDAASGGIADVAAFVGGVASLTDLLGLNSGFDRTAGVPAVGDLARETSRAAGAMALRLAGMRRESTEALRALAAIDTALADLAARHAAIGTAAEAQAAMTVRLAQRLERAERIIEERS